MGERFIPEEAISPESRPKETEHQIDSATGEMGQENEEEAEREAEKSLRQEVRKLLGQEVSRSLARFGFRKTGSSLWSRAVGDSLQLVYLQRSRFGHNYYIEAGICSPKDIPTGERPNIVFCPVRDRIEAMVAEKEKQIFGEGQEVEGKIKREKAEIQAALDFEATGASKKRAEGGPSPSVSLREAKIKMEKIGLDVCGYIPSWFEARSSKSKG